MSPVIRPLAAVSLAAPPPSAAYPGLGAVAASLRYQARALGMLHAAPFDEPASSVSGMPFSLDMAGAAVTGRVTGWPDDGARPASELTIQAATGLMSIHGRSHDRPQALGVPYVSVLAATLALQGALAAALGQLRGIATSGVSTSLAAAGLLAAGQYLAGATAPDGPESLLPGTGASSEQPPFSSADGVAFELETLDAGPWRAFWTEVGVDADLAGKGWRAFLLRYAKGIAPLPRALPDALARLPYARIAALGAQTGVAVCPVRTLDERASDADARTLWHQGPWTFARGAAAPPADRSPKPGDALPLSGLTVIESCRRIQGPLAGHLLALLGADVIRIEPPGGDPLRGMPPMADGVSARFDALNRLKRIRELDIKSVRGQAELRELASGADVFLHNWAPGRAQALSLDAPAFSAVNPALVYAYAGGWGAGSANPLPGTDFIAQAYSGIAHWIGETSGTPGGSLLTVLDVLGGVVAAQGVVAALLDRRIGGTGQRMESSLLGAATLLSADELRVLFAAGTADSRIRETRSHPDRGIERDAGDSPSSSKADGLSVLASTQSAVDTDPGGHADTLPDDVPDPLAQPLIDRVYATREGLLALTCFDTRSAASAAQAAGLDYRGPDTLAADLSRALPARTAHDWQTLLAAHGVASAAVVEALTDLRDDPRLAGCVSVDTYTQIRSPWRFQ
ncbi:CoA transferase [Burkholderia alba]|uniref:CoA transferase n=1 Tax=Burkholderia alba TaxID=2683677 RepID=UPI002B056108|nr:CoA transferase [Burkholderia alba]